jgi:glycosyltransferase involved in cell wall biosynthesis
MHLEFSVIIPLYNKAAYVRNTIESVLTQTLADFEIIVIDDGSTDNGADIINSINDSRIRLVRQKNAGVSAARNHGIQQANAEWVAFLDADDWYHPQYLETLHQLICQHPSVSVVATQYKSINHAPGKIIDSWPVSPMTAEVELIRNLPSRWLKETAFFTSSVAVRLSLLKTMQPCFPEGESTGEDLDLWFRLAEVSPIALCKAHLVARMWVSDGLSVTHKAQIEPPFLLRMVQRARSSSMQPQLAISTLRFVDEVRITLAQAAIAAGNRQIAIGLLWRGRGAGIFLRWWISLGMLLLMPAKTVDYIKKWRKRRNKIS